jgi:hypothetical protein
MKTVLLFCWMSLVIGSSCAQSRLVLNPEKYEYPDTVTDARPISVAEIRKLTEQQILEALPDVDFYHDPEIRELLKCIALYRFKMNFFRKGERAITDIESHFNKISFEMKLILNNAQPGDVVQFDYIQCVRSDYEYRKRSGVIFKVVE